MLEENAVDIWLDYSCLYDVKSAGFKTSLRMLHIKRREALLFPRLMRMSKTFHKQLQICLTSVACDSIRMRKYVIL